jgi:6-phosphogluconolactonase
MNLPNENKEVLIFKNAKQIADFTIKKWTEISERAIHKKRYFTAAISGGRTPSTLYQELALVKSLPWDKTHIFMVDERFVPPEHKQSNYRMINQSLLSGLDIPGENIHPISTYDETPLASAEKYEEELISFFNLTNDEIPKFNLILLGIGEDGHTASIFPDTSSLREANRLAVSVSPPDKSRKERITITLPVINNAENIFFLAIGNSKARVIQEVIEGENHSLPAALVRQKRDKLFFLLDEEAGSLLSKDKR